MGNVSVINEGDAMHVMRSGTNFVPQFCRICCTNQSHYNNSTWWPADGYGLFFSRSLCTNGICHSLSSLNISLDQMLEKRAWHSSSESLHIVSWFRFLGLSFEPQYELIGVRMTEISESCLSCNFRLSFGTTAAIGFLNRLTFTQHYTLGRRVPIKYMIS
jgi:hypothetical protein